ncbi:MAG: hypothetical protein BWY56_02384 [Acidobacteria bacterium ADurb.Bin340]|nr:MAG: hypothetical protein BWY56_02384 [Acidobacteria bacterium ADurb.Bin340]
MIAAAGAGQFLLQVVGPELAQPVGIDKPVPLGHQAEGLAFLQGGAVVGHAVAGAVITREFGTVHAELEAVIDVEDPVQAGEEGVRVPLAGVVPSASQEDRIRRIGSIQRHGIGGAIAPDLDHRTAVPLEIAAHEVEELVRNDRAAHGKAVLPVGEIIHRLACQMGIGHQTMGPLVEEEGPGEIIGAGLGDGVQVTATHAAEFGAGAIGDHLEFTDGFHGHGVGRATRFVAEGAGEETGVVAGAIHGGGGVHAPLAGDGQITAAAGAHHGGEIREVVPAAADEGQFLQFLGLEQGRGGGALGVHLGAGRNDFHHRPGLGSKADHQRSRIAQAQVQPDVGSRLEPGLGHCDAVGPDRKQRRHVTTVFIGLDSADKTGFRAANDHCGRGNRATFPVQHATRKLSGNALGHQGRSGDDQRKQTGPSQGIGRHATSWRHAPDHPARKGINPNGFPAWQSRPGIPRNFLCFRGIPPRQLLPIPCSRPSTHRGTVSVAKPKCCSRKAWLMAEGCRFNSTVWVLISTSSTKPAAG